MLKLYSVFQEFPNQDLDHYYHNIQNKMENEKLQLLLIVCMVVEMRIKQHFEFIKLLIERKKFSGAAGGSGSTKTTSNDIHSSVSTVGDVLRDGSKGKRTSGATGERLRIDPGHDPKNHTFIQKAYLYDRAHLQYYLREPTTNEQQEPKNLDGLWKGLGEQRRVGNVAKGKRNDALRDEVGIWNE